MTPKSSYQPRPLLETPAALVQDGQFQLGTYKTPLTQVNPLDAKVNFPLLPNAWKQMRLKEWQHFALVNERVYVSIALFDAKLLALAQVCVYDRTLGKTIFHEKQMLPGQLKALPNELFDAKASLETPKFTLRIHNHLDQGVHHIAFDIAGTRSLPSVKGEFTCFESLDSIEPIVVCLPLGNGRAMYSHKAVTAAEGTMHLGPEKIDFPKDQSYGLIDIHKGYYPYVMKWNWATGGGYRKDGTLLGFNLTNNQVRDQDAYNENCLWVDGKLHLLPPVTFSYNSPHTTNPWSIRDAHGQVDLHFQPEVIRTVNLNLLFLRSRYRGPFGAFTGSIYDNDGQKHDVEAWFGMCEEFYLRL
ncbi:MAG: DUF2804 domain-containing protein [Myxococcales bacterium]|nr:DUF2804 domain-containing protein [Myxococcales bacterium]MCB9642313.1 DUF2804 domain-containing protein [Myxococcales bacterium]